MHQFRQHLNKLAIAVTPRLRLRERRITRNNFLRCRPLQFESLGDLTLRHMRLFHFLLCIAKEKARVADIDLIRLKDISTPLYDFSDLPDGFRNHDKAGFLLHLAYECCM